MVPGVVLRAQGVDDRELGDVGVAAEQVVDVRSYFEAHLCWQQMAIDWFHCFINYYLLNLLPMKVSTLLLLTVPA
jgi:hypothetical protein